MKINMRYSNNPTDVANYTTTQLRENFLIDGLFAPDTVELTYSHNDRIMVAGLMPVNQSLTLVGGKDTGTDYFFERREGGVINIGGTGTITLDGTAYELNNQDALYIGRGVKDIQFVSKDKTNPAKFYFNSTPAHHTYPNKLIDLAAANKVHLGTAEECNKRTINQYIVPATCETCQLTMGMTAFEPGSIWNTMPPHTHDRRMEVYLYFNMAPKTKVFHFMGEPTQTKHLIVGNEQAVISPSWSIHCGAGTGPYTFIWSMCGENQTFTDMDHCDMDDLR